jgi:ATP-binding cassette subfamily B protein
MGVISFASGQVMTRATQSFLLSLRTRLFAHLHTLSMDFFEQHRLGDLLSRVGADVTAVEALVLSGVSSAISAGLQVVVYGVMLFVVDPTLAASAIVVSPLLWVINRVFSRRLKAASRQSRQQMGRLSSIAEESLSTVSLVQAYNRQHDEVRRFEDEGRNVVRTAMRSSLLRGIYTPSVELVELSGLMLVIGYGTWQLGHHAMTLGSLLVFMAYFSQLYGPLQGLGQLSNSFYSASAGAERIIEVLDARPSVTDHAAARPFPHANGVIEFRDVSFSYPGRDRPSLRGVSFIARPGQLIAIVGRSGSGKSTLGKLLLRFYDPTSGSVTLDGHDLRDLRLNDLRQHLALVMQETLVMDGTILDNILWGRPDATAGTFHRAVAAADVDTVIAELPDGLRTRVGYRGRALSGGQRQRVAIARAMIRDAPVLLLDEPATGLDVVAERRVLEPLKRLMGGRTTILISHDLHAVRDADLILVLERGQVVESGTHRELFALGGHYRRLCLTQQNASTEPPLDVPAPAGTRNSPERHQSWTPPTPTSAPATIPIPVAALLEVTNWPRATSV